ncbi:MAG: RNA polymerase sigma factor [Phycisphaerae bacterium]
MATQDQSEKDRIESVVKRAQDGCANAFDELVDAYSSRVYGFLFRLIGRRDEAEELAQDVFVRVVRSIHGYQDQGKFDAWLFRIASNLVRDRVRKQVRAPRIQPLIRDDDESPKIEAVVDPMHPAPDEGMRKRDDADKLQHALAQLSEAEREVIMLRHYSQMSFQEIAEVMETPLGTALARGHRGLGKLKELLEE